jgi:methanethiol S-methyltransferase
MLLLAVLWLAWCAVHSLLITTRVKQWFERRGGIWVGLYRIMYVCFALLTLLPLLWYTSSLPQQPFSTPPLWLQSVQWMLLLYAIMLFIGGLRVYDLQAFLGIRQWRDYRAGKTNALPSFKIDGILRYVRHPWYSGGVALLWGLPNLSDVTLITRLILSGYLIVGTLLEERKLQQSLGEAYRTYCQEVPMLIPWKFWHQLPPRTSL